MAIQTVELLKNHAVSADAGGGAVFIYPDQGALGRDKSVYFLSSNGALSGQIGSVYNGTFYPMAYGAWTSSIGGSFFFQPADFLITEYPISIAHEFHNNFGRPAIRFDASGGATIDLVVGAGM